MSRSRSFFVLAAVLNVTVAAVAGCAAAPAPPSTAAGTAPGPVVDGGAASTVPDESTVVGGIEVTTADGYASTSEPVTVLRDTPAIANLDADLRAALVTATEAAQQDGVRVLVNSGWRSTAYQRALLAQAVEDHGSLEGARRWVNTPERSTHVTGAAVDVGAPDAAVWMQQNGSRFGLCQTYANESWHYELATTPGGTCPEMLADSTLG